MSYEKLRSTLGAFGIALLVFAGGAWLLGYRPVNASGAVTMFIYLAVLVLVYAMSRPPR